MEIPKENLTPISEIGEFGLIERLTKNFKLKNPTSIKGVGDDAAVIDCGDKVILFTTDMLVEGVHFDMVYVPLKHLGYKAAIVNFSDVFAMNGTPKQMTVSFAVSSRFSVEAMEEIYSGIHAACEKYGVDLVGGDTTSSRSGMVISISVLGEAQKEDVVYRSTAKKGDLLCLSGDVGGAYLGLLLLEREKRIFLESPGVQPELKGKDYILKRQLMPEAKRETIQLFKELGIKPTSMIDVSDGLSSECLHLCKNSGLGCALYEEKIPIDSLTKETANELNLDPLTCALMGGEDYELLFTISQSDYEKVFGERSRTIKDNPGIIIIGHTTDLSDGCNLILSSGQSIPITAQGWDSFKSKENQ